MRRDLIIGLLCSILVHAGLGLGGQINLNFFSKKKVVKKDEVPAIQIELPKLDPEPPDPTDNDQSANDNASIAPPSIADVPGVVDVSSFVQAVQPPPPPPGGMTMTVPKNNVQVSKNMSEVFDLKNLDQQPVPKFRQQPAYPFEMKRQGISAEVLVEFICDSNGEVREAKVVKSDNHAFDSAALDAIYKWKFRAGKKGGRSVSAHMQQPFVFSIADE
jgi:periplasmic protein TonB